MKKKTKPKKHYFFFLLQQTPFDVKLPVGKPLAAVLKKVMNGMVQACCHLQNFSKQAAMKRSLDLVKPLCLLPRGSQFPPPQQLPVVGGCASVHPAPRGCARQSTLCVTPGLGLPGEKKHSRNMLGSDTPPRRWYWPFGPSWDLRSRDGVSGLTPVGLSALLFYSSFVSQHLHSDSGPLRSCPYIVQGRRSDPITEVGKQEVIAVPGMVAGLVSLPRCFQDSLLLAPSETTEVAHSQQDHPQSHLGTLTFLTPTFQVMGNKPKIFKSRKPDSVNCLKMYPPETRFCSGSKPKGTISANERDRARKGWWRGEWAVVSEHPRCIPLPGTPPTEWAQRDLGSFRVSRCGCCL